MKTFSTVLAALTLTFSGSAIADRDGWRGHRSDRHYGHQKDFRSHHHHDYGRHYRGHGYHGPRISQYHYGAPAYYVAPPQYYGYGHRGGGVTIVLPPIQLGY